jgi:lysophospholipase L1-like esterase
MIPKLIWLTIIMFFLAACYSVELTEIPVTASENKPLNTSTSAAVIAETQQIAEDPFPTMEPPPSPTPLPTDNARPARSMDIVTYEADDERILYNGRFDFQNPKTPAFDWSATSIEFDFSGTSLAIFLQDGRNSYNVTLDDQRQVLKTEMGVEEYVIASNLKPDRHHFTLSKRTEAYVGAAEFKGLKITGGELEQALPAAERLIEFIGDSITTGYGNEGESPDCWFTPDTQNADKSYAALTAQELDAGYTLIALSGLGVIRNLRAEDPTSFETAVHFVDRALGLNPFVIWPNDRRIPDAVVINLGTNDYSSIPFPDEEEFINAYMELISAIRTRYPEAFIFAVAGPLMLDPAPTLIHRAVERFTASYDDDQLQYVKIENNLQPSAEDFGCDFHPNLNGHRKIAAQLSPVVASRLGW